jgi:hypothetical protein
MKKTLVLHPILFTLYAIMALFINNITQMELANVRVLLFAALGAVALLVILRLIIKDAVKAGLIASGVILLSFSYGHVQTLSEDWPLFGEVIDQPGILALVWLCILAIWSYGVLARWRNLEAVNGYLNWVSLILNVFPIYTFVMFTRQSQAAAPLIPAYASQVWEQSGVLEIDEMPDLVGEDRPDIYYIILDAYTRADVLEALYGYDNRWFVQALEDRGFFVAEASQSNYTETVLSITSALNMAHLDTMPDYFLDHAELDNDWIVNQVTESLMDANKVTEFLKSRDYTFVTYDSGYAKTISEHADVYLSPPGVGDLNTQEMMFEMMLLDTSLGRVYMRLRGEAFTPLQALFDAQRQRVIFTLESLPEFARKEGDYFVFAHIVSPHTPFVFGPQGEAITGVDPFTLMDIHPGREENVPLYRGQVNYLNRLVLQTVDRILEDSTEPPIIIIQGDHSSKVYSQTDPSEDIRMSLLFPILNAYHYPGVSAEKVYPSITPVNTFRVLFDAYFGTGLGLLPDRSYLLESSRGRREFVDVCQTYAFCAP